MSGGSYNYLYGKDPAEVVQQYAYPYEFNDLKRMQAALAELHPLSRAAMATTALDIHIEDFLQYVEATQSELYDVLRAVEWYHSSDGGLDDVAKAVEQYERRPE